MIPTTIISSMREKPPDVRKCGRCMSVPQDLAPGKTPGYSTGGIRDATGLTRHAVYAHEGCHPAWIGIPAEAKIDRSDRHGIISATTGSAATAATDLVIAELTVAVDIEEVLGDAGTGERVQCVEIAAPTRFARIRARDHRREHHYAGHDLDIAYHAFALGGAGSRRRQQVHDPSLLVHGQTCI